ncbi:hypothetical protein JX265_009184 [Neoarthrinium moseri]|uniref:NACHT domain-containing protein n=1 Tax=Neoarthrinium moseri TaxID=1658444 RepID=A0A9Q0AMW4_9PEZI|nr:hypothetical protein JX265_009184 [Neoarthrinium moseri]
MEPLTALALAGNIGQSAEFALKLIKGTAQIHSSACGTSDKNSHLEGISERLMEFSSRMKYVHAKHAANNDSSFSLSYYSPDLEDLVAKCTEDCKQLLQISRKLQVTSASRNRKWDSFKKAMYDVWHEKDIAQLQDQISKHRQEIVMMLSAISIENTEQTSLQLQQLISETNILRAERLNQFDLLATLLQNVYEQIKLIKTRVIKPDDGGIIRGYSIDEVEVLTADVSRLTSLQRKYAREEFVLSGLNFEQRPMRHNSIPRAHMKTFKWVFTPVSTQDSTQPLLIQWLESGEGVYWISGKPGCGKSTLLKYICQNDKTTEHLSTWAGDARIVVASHFFWSSGSSMQRSREGLLRSLLYDILSQLPELIPIICARSEVPLLIQQITERAEGVFLWVFLVVRQLRDGLMNGDSLEDLTMRLDIIPTDLERFFKQILETVEPFYHQKQSRTLQLAIVAEEPLRLELYSFQDLEHRHEDYALGNSMRVFDGDEFERFHGPMAKRLNSRCKGLLEVRDRKVEFLHRTVRDFLRSAEMADFLRNRSTGSFKPALSILRAHIAWMKSTRFNNGSTSSESGEESFLFRLSQILDYAQVAENQDSNCRRPVAELLDELELVLQTMVLTGQIIMPDESMISGQDMLTPAEGIVSLFRKAVIEKNLRHFISWQLGRDAAYFTVLAEAPLLLAAECYAAESLVTTICFTTTRPDGSPGTASLIQLFLESGFDPNKQLIVKPMNGLTSPWTEFMSLIAPWHQNSDLAHALPKQVQSCYLHALKLGVFTHFLRHGANPNSRVPNWYASERQQERDVYYSPTIGTIWVFLGFTVTDVWRHSEVFLRDLKSMIAAGAHFDDLGLGGTFEIPEQKKEMQWDSTMNSESIFDLEQFKSNSAKWNVDRANQDRARQEKKGSQLKATRWQIIVAHLCRKGVPERQLLRTKIIIEVAKADSRKVLPWAMLVDAAKDSLARHLVQAISKAIQDG